MKAIVQDEHGSPGMKHHRVVVTRHSGPDVLQVVEEDLPEPRAGEVRVKVLAAVVSAYDLMFRRSGSLPGTPRVPFTLGEDIVGVVDKLGEGVSTVEPGQVVAGATFCLGVGGGYAEVVACPPASWRPSPRTRTLPRPSAWLSAAAKWMDRLPLCRGNIPWMEISTCCSSSTKCSIEY